MLLISYILLLQMMYAPQSFVIMFALTANYPLMIIKLKKVFLFTDMPSISGDSIFA